MDIKILISMSNDYFNIVVPDKEYDPRDPYPNELSEFSEFAADVMRIPTDVYTVNKFYGPEAGSSLLQSPEILVAIATGSLASSIQSLFQCITKYLSRNDNREITIERGGTRLTIKGKGRCEEEEYIRLLFPELLSEQQKAKKRTKKHPSQPSAQD